MKIGKLVKTHIEKINLFCENEESAFKELLNPEYCKDTFGINYPFYEEVNLIDDKLHRRYYTTTYTVRGKAVRITNHWFPEHHDSFLKYLLSKKIINYKDLEQLNANEQETKHCIRNPRKNTRYKGNAIGNSSNLLVRNILSNLGLEQFNKDDWLKTKKYFDNSCAYCGNKDSLIMEHAIPINKELLGEHKLGNIVPSCKKCNVKKGNKRFDNFLDDNKKIEYIRQYMDEKNYVPLGDNEQVRAILEMAYEEVSIVSKRYIAILNGLSYKQQENT
ncbi:hypothetical protein SPONL_1442 [uncultured Candidatus Thioglobus sp.]|nr:hypothetical protein SPONL_1442 [uncultured Candidatus Thioglobus sp.]